MTALVLIGVILLFFAGAIFAFESLATPAFMSNLQTIQMPAGVSFFADFFELGTGLTIIVSAYTARFILRRIPLIG